VGVVDVSLSLPELRVPSGFSGWSGSQGGRIALEEHALEPGKTQREYDVRDRFPGGIEVSARVNGEPVAGLVVQAISTEPMSSSGVCVLDAEGRGVMRPVVPATYRITAKPIDGGWWYRDERSVQLAANGTARVLLEIQVVESELLVVDEVTRAPLADALLQIGFAGAEWPEIEARTDGEGRMRRALAVGSYVLWSGGRSAAPAPGPSFEWPARGSAPMTLAIRSDG
jgi:hypothetical protein